MYRSIDIVDGNYRNESRAIILKKYHSRMKTVEDMKYWLITNEEDNIKQSLAPRWDLLS
jgi:negative regulator of replication initiation